MISEKESSTLHYRYYYINIKHQGIQENHIMQARDNTLSTSFLLYPGNKVFCFVIDGHISPNTLAKN